MAGKLPAQCTTEKVHEGDAVHWGFAAKQHSSQLYLNGGDKL